MSKRNARVIKVLAGAAALAGVGYAFARRSSGRSARGLRGRAVRGSVSSPTDSESPPMRAPATTVTEPAFGMEAERISSAPDALDVALDLTGVFDGKSESGVAVTARPNEHVPSLRAGDDEDAPSPEDLGQTWLTQATETERSLGIADTIPDVDGVSPTIEELGEATDIDGDGVDDDETTAEYVRRHRISSMEWTPAPAMGKKDV